MDEISAVFAILRPDDGGDDTVCGFAPSIDFCAVKAGLRGMGFDVEKGELQSQLEHCCPHALQKDPRRARTVHVAPMGCTEYVGQLQRTHDCFGTRQPRGVSAVPVGMAVAHVLQQWSCAQAEPQKSGCSCARVAQPWAWKSVHAEARPAPPHALIGADRR